MLAFLVPAVALALGSAPTLSIDDATVHEANDETGVVLTVTLAPASLEEVRVRYATADGTADSTDYGQTSGTLTFAPGMTTARIPIVINADALDEPDETFFLDLSDAHNATIARARGTVTIVDDDPAPFLLLDAYVDARWNVHRRYTRVARFAIHRPAGTVVKVRCRGDRCPVRVGAKLRPRTLVDVRIEALYKPLIGRVYQYRIRAGKRPRFTPLCLPPGALKPVRC